MLVLLTPAALAKDAVDFSGTYSARIKSSDGSVATRVIQIVQTADTVRIETVGSKFRPIWYKLGKSILVTDSQGQDHRESASISSRVLRIEVEHHSPPDAVTGTEQTLYTLSKDGKHLKCTHSFEVIGPSFSSSALTDDYTRVEEPPATTQPK